MSQVVETLVVDLCGLLELPVNDVTDVEANIWMIGRQYVDAPDSSIRSWFRNDDGSEGNNALAAVWAATCARLVAKSMEDYKTAQHIRKLLGEKLVGMEDLGDGRTTVWF